MQGGKTIKESPGERGTALVVALLALALMMTLVMGMSLTAISEMGVTNTYANQTQAFEAAEAGLYHALNLVRNYTNAGGSPNFTNLLGERPDNPGDPKYPDYLYGKNPFTNAAKFAPGCAMIDNAVDGSGNPITVNGAPVGHQVRDANGNVVPGAFYSVHMIDDEKTASAAGVKVPNFNPSIAWEDGDATKDTNNRVVVYSTGTYGSASVTLEGWIGFMPYPALVAQYDITISGSADIQGAYGGVHSNRNLIVSGGGWSVEQTATASGIISPSVSAAAAHTGGFTGQGQAQLYLPKFVTSAPLTSGGPATSPRIADYIIQKADTLLFDPSYASTNRTGETAQQRVNKLEARLNLTTNSLWNVLTTGGANPSQEQGVTITRDSTGIGTPTLINSLNGTGWRYNNGNGGYWDIQSASVDGHGYYIVGLDNYNLTTPASSTANGGNVKLTSNAGTDSNPIHLSILTTGSIEVAGNPNFISQINNVQTGELPPFVAPNFLLVATEDVKIRGDASVPRFSGVIFAGEQFDLSGNGAIDGQVLGLSNTDMSGSPVSDNTITGSFDLTFNGGQAVGRIMLMSWRQIKQ